MVMISRGVEISITGGVEETEDVSKARDVFFFCLTHIFSVNVQELACSSSYGINKRQFQSN